MTYFLRVFVFWLLLVGMMPMAHAAEVQVHDGDTFRVDGVKIRLWGVDAPELKQSCIKKNQTYPCGKKAKVALEALIGKEGDIECKVVDIDVYKRNVARCNVAGADLGSMMVRLGQAVAYKRYSKDFYSEQEHEAQKAKRGLWGMEFENPWAWRSQHKR